MFDGFNGDDLQEEVYEDKNDDDDEDEDEVGDDNQVRLPRRQPRQSQLRRLARVSSGIVRLSSILITIIIVTLGIVLKMWKMRGTIFAASGGNAGCGRQPC